MTVEQASEPGRDGSASLDERLRDMIRREGPITFDRFMAAALYDPVEGFYAGLPVGPEGHFWTSPHASPAFGRLLAVQVDELWDLLGRPSPFAVVELGAADGTLARQLLPALSVELRRAVRYLPVEPGAAGRERLEALAAEETGVLAPIADVADAGPVGAGCVVANEVLDNVPFHRLAGTPSGVVELFVGLDGDRFVTATGPPSSTRLVELAGRPGPGEERVASPAALDLVDRAAGLLDRGYLLFLDYASTAESVVHGYRAHRVVGDVLDAPGSRDITAGVDLDALTGHARARGWSVWGPVSQRELLESLGIGRFEEDALRAQQAALDERRGLDAVRLYSERNRLRLLTDPGGLGGLQAVCIGVGTDRGPRWATDAEGTSD